MPGESVGMDGDKTGCAGAGTNRRWRYEMKKAAIVWTMLKAVMLTAVLGACPTPIEETGANALPAVTDVKLYTIHGGLRAEWTAVEGAESYSLSYDESETPPEKPQITGITETYQAIFEPSVNVWVQAVGSGGSSPLIEPVSSESAVQWNGNPPAAPEGVSVETVNGGLYVTWVQNPVEVSYNVYYADSPKAPATPQLTGITETYTPITGLEPDKVYYVWVQAVSAGASSQLTTTPEAAKAGLPTGRDFKITDDNSITFAAAIVAINASKAEGLYRITLAKNETVSTEIIFETGAAKTIIIRDDGARTIKNASDGPLFTVKGSNTLILQNKVVLDGNEQSHPVVKVDGGALVIQDDAVITNATASGVSIENSGKFTMKGGTISKNAATDKGGGVFVNGGTFTMEGGTITENEAASGGGGVFVNDGTFTMENGTITENEATGDSGYGGGVFVNDGTFTMKGGTISKNTATENDGGGVYVGGGAFTMKGNAAISENEAANGGGVFVNGGSFTMEGGTISKNTATGNGGGVYVNEDGTFTKKGGGVIYGSNDNGNKNTASGSPTAGHVAFVYVGSDDKRARDNTADTSDDMHYSKEKGWDEA
jgi:predicted outer membrane repeat protein